MTELEDQTSTEALRQAREALRSLPTDASVSVRCNAVTTAVRALTVYRELHLAVPLSSNVGHEVDA